jgi:nucleoside-diphosphate-sugar epimerase
VKKNQRTILITGATGFIGGYLVDRIKDSYNVYTLSRRFPKNVEYQTNPNLKWLQADIGEKASIAKALKSVDREFPIEYIIHLAGFYDFNYDNNPEYERTNINGTKNLLEEIKKLNIKRFIFASSVAACEFPRENGERITERTPPDAPFSYAVSKRKGEEMVKEYSKFYKCTTVRFAAAFSDWCEYGPLYMFLDTWLTRNWKSRILGGKGKSAIPYIHVNCLINLLLEVIDKCDSLPRHDTYIASGSNSSSHEELFDLATRSFYGESRKPFHLPKLISRLGLVTMDFFGKLIGKRPFERPWMIRYIDKQMLVDNSYTREQLDWFPTRRFVLNHRLLYMIEHMKSYPYEWQKRNQLLLKQRKVSPNFLIYEALDRLRDKIITKCVDYLLDPKNAEQFKMYHTLDKAILRKDTNTLYQFLSVAVRTKDRMSVIRYAREIAQIRSQQDFDPQEVLDAVKVIGSIIHDELVNVEQLKRMRQEIYDEINFTFQLAIDEIEGTYESIFRSKTSIAQLVYTAKGDK